MKMSLNVFKPATIILVIWATVTLFIDFTVLYDEWGFAFKLIAVMILLILSMKEYNYGDEKT